MNHAWGLNVSADVDADALFQLTLGFHFLGSEVVHDMSMSYFSSSKQLQA